MILKLYCNPKSKHDLANLIMLLPICICISVVGASNRNTGYIVLSFLNKLPTRQRKMQYKNTCLPLTKRYLYIC